MPSSDLDTLEKVRRMLSDTIARMRPATPEEEALKDDLVAKRDAVAAEQDRLIDSGFEGSIQGIDRAWSELEGACRGLKTATDRIAATKKILELAGVALTLAAKATARLV